MDTAGRCTHHSTACLTSCDVLLSLRYGFGASLSGVHVCLYLSWEDILSHSSFVIHSSMYEIVCRAVHRACCPQQADAFCMAGTPQICPALPNNQLQDLGPLVANSDHKRTPGWQGMLSFTEIEAFVKTPRVRAQRRIYFRFRQLA